MEGGREENGDGQDGVSAGSGSLLRDREWVVDARAGSGRDPDGSATAGVRAERGLLGHGRRLLQDRSVGQGYRSCSPGSGEHEAGLVDTIVGEDADAVVSGRRDRDVEVDPTVAAELAEGPAHPLIDDAPGVVQAVHQDTNVADA